MNNKEKLLDYFKADNLASEVWKGKYALETEVTPDDMHLRMAKEFARVEEDYSKKEKFKDKGLLSKYGKNREELNTDKIYSLFKDFKYIVPQGSIMSTLGTDLIASLSNCWVVESPTDSYSGIHKTDGDLIYYYKRRGGCGADISNLRPKDTKTNNTAKSSTGAVSFMNRFSNTTREVAMNGRRGALMLSIDVRHPDVMDFIKVKRDLSQVTGANISVRINNEFMGAVENNEDYILRFPCNFDMTSLVAKNIEEITSQPYNELREVGSGLYVKRVKAKEYWDEIIKSARDFAEPGLMYWDTALDYDPAAVYDFYKPISTNPLTKILAA
jgi:ribonucleoside-diphosphate reductase alpha chain